MNTISNLVDIKNIFTIGKVNPDLYKIPKRFFSTWKTSLINLEQANFLSEFRNKHPDFTFEFFDDDAMDAYMAEVYGDHPIFEVYKNSVYGASKADIWRYCILYDRGGIYLDFDSAIMFDMNSIPDNISELISFESNKLTNFVYDTSLPNYQFFLERNFKNNKLNYPEYPVLQWCLIFSKKHKILEIVIQNIVEQADFYRNKIFPSAANAIINFTAPIQLTCAVWKYVEAGNIVSQFGIDFNGHAAFKRIENNTSYIQEYSFGYHNKTNVQILKDGVRLNMGCGKTILKGFSNIDICQYSPEVVVEDVRSLSLPRNSVDEIYAKDVIVHMGLPDAFKAIKHWVSLLKSGGLITIQTTSFELISKAFLSNKLSISGLNYLMFAGVNWSEGYPDWCSIRSTEFDWHKSVYTEKLLTELLQENGFNILSIHFDNIDDLAGDAFLGTINHGLNLRIRALKI